MSRPPEPAPRDVAIALRKTTETLARELASPSSATPAWTDFEWRIAEAASAMHGVSALLARGLRWQGPARWQRFLDEQRHQTRVRHERIDAFVQRLDTLARGEGVGMTALKGVALHALGLYRAGERPICVRRRAHAPGARQFPRGRALATALSPRSGVEPRRGSYRDRAE